MLHNIAKKGQLLFLFSFAALMLLGTFLLKLPWIMKSGIPMSWTDAAFMATSAVCITGLTTVPLHEMSFAGQFLIVLMVQTGGIGIMTLSASILLALGKGLSFSDTLMFSSLNDNFSLRGTEGLTRTVIRYSLAAEGIGAVIIYTGLLFNGGNWLLSVWHAVFIAVTSFCNAGMTPFADNMVSQHLLTRIGCAGLVIFGGLGVYVIYDLCIVLKKKKAALRLHSKVVIGMTLALLAAGTLLLKYFGLKDQAELSWTDALFLSISSRTAGFSTFEVSQLSDTALLTTMILMLIGASPGSTGGGMKTTTIAVAAAAIWNTFKGNQQVLMFKREIPHSEVLRAFSIIVIFLLITYAGAVSVQLLSPETDLSAILFESISALTTTGLSFDNTTSALRDPAKIMLSVLMYVGRMGPFTIMLFLLSKEKRSTLKYPQERVIIG